MLRTALHNEAKEITMKVFVTLMAVVALSILLQSEQVTADKWSRKLLQARSRGARLRKSPGGKRKSNQGGAWSRLARLRKPPVGKRKSNQGGYGNPSPQQDNKICLT